MSKRETLDTDFLQEIFPEFDKKAFTDALHELNRQQNKLDSTGKIIRSLIEVRSDFLKKFRQTDSPDIKKEECPLCGFDWKKTETLLGEIEKKTEFFEGMLSDEAKIFREKKNNFVSAFLDPLGNQIEKKLLTPEFSISDFFVEKLCEAQKQEENSNKLIAWFKEKEIDYSSLQVTKPNEEVDEGVLANRRFELTERIKRKAPAKSEEYQRKDTEFKFSEIFNAAFNNEPKNLMGIDPATIEKKREYIENQYFQSLEGVRAELKNLEIRSKKLETVENNLTAAIDIYKREIGQYRQRVIQDIEIPFFIYCGKILQTIRKANTTGVFIKDPTSGDELKNIRFVTDWETDHDVINTTSSGQLAGIVIALTLAMNRIYSTGLASIFIDDPVQTMDDLNMISLVELLRNDFSDKQLFLSTHEREIENYILYKYIKYGRSVGRVNCMTKEVHHRN
ncbi:MAG: hypothetical protein GY950_14420 [bacterium]|nr:hypothetical protein [bacterium]